MMTVFVDLSISNKIAWMIHILLEWHRRYASLVIIIVVLTLSPHRFENYFLSASVE